MSPNLISIEIALPPDKTFDLLCVIAEEFSHGQKGWWGLLFGYSTLDVFSNKGVWRITSQDKKLLILELVWKKWFSEDVHLKASVTQIDIGRSLIHLDARPIALIDLSSHAEIPLNLLIAAIEKQQLL